MKKTLASVAVLALCTAAPAFADHHVVHHYKGDGHRHHHVASTNMASSRSTEVNTYRVDRPLTHNEVMQRRAMQTQIEKEMKRADLNGDRMVDCQEYAFGDRVLQKDNLDSKVSFERIDANKDGKLSSQEVMDYRWKELVGPEVSRVSTTRTVTYRD